MVAEAKQVIERTTPYCPHALEEVQIQTSTVYPIDLLPDLPWIASRRCSHRFDCNLHDLAACPQRISRLRIC
jgi:hypothetical protein